MAATGRRPGRMPRPEPEMWPGVSWSSSYDLTGSRGSNAVGQGAESDFDANVARSVVGPFAGVRHHDPGQVAHHGRHIGASINDERKACRLDDSTQPRAVSSWRMSRLVLTYTSTFAGGPVLKSVTSRAHSSREKWGVPRLTAVKAAPSDTVERHRMTPRRSSGPSSIVSSGGLP